MSPCHSTASISKADGAPDKAAPSPGGVDEGVALADGTEIHAPVVVSALDPRRTFTELVDPRELPTDLVERSFVRPAYLLLLQ